jgi:excisionase family DNA binding protein
MITQSGNALQNNCNCIKTVIFQLDLTYEEAAERFEVDKSTIYRWLSNKSNPSKKYIRKAKRLAKRNGLTL